MTRIATPRQRGNVALVFTRPNAPDERINVGVVELDDAGTAILEGETGLLRVQAVAAPLLNQQGRALVRVDVAINGQATDQDIDRGVLIAADLEAYLRQQVTATASPPPTRRM